MKQAQRVLSTYSVDIFGVCSALYELGGLVIIHDASGCNSTYGTHNEPRWYDTPSMVYISMLREVDTIFGNDTKLIDAICEVAEEAQPAFIAVGGSPMPNAIGTDFTAVEKMIERRTGIPSMGFRTDGIHSYLPGAGASFRRLAERFLKDPDPADRKGSGLAEGNREPAGSDVASDGAERLHVNLLGITPLDLSVVGNVTRLKSLLDENDMVLQSCWAMGDTLESISTAACADVNAVITSVGIPAAEYMKEKYGIPYVVGMPMGEAGTKRWLEDLRTKRSALFEGIGTADDEGWNPMGSGRELFSLNAWEETPITDEDNCDVLLIGEPVFTESLKYLLENEAGVARVGQICPMTDAPKKLLKSIDVVSVEDALRERCRRAGRVIADPIYARLLPEEPEKFVSLPHEAYSGRHYRENIPRFIGPEFSEWIRRLDL